MQELDDTQRLNWLEANSGFAVVSDDFGNWAVTASGMQNIPETIPGDLETTFWIEAKEWKKSIREAIDFAISESEK